MLVAQLLLSNTPIGWMMFRFWQWPGFAYNDFHAKEKDTSQITLHAYRYCYSCMSQLEWSMVCCQEYLTLWPTLLNQYYPPRNFSRLCDHPNRLIARDWCDDVCVTLVENEEVGGMAVKNRYMRGCASRLLLFGLNPSLHNQLSMAASRPDGEQCRLINRRLLLPEHAAHTYNTGHQQSSLQRRQRSQSTGGGTSFTVNSDVFNSLASPRMVDDTLRICACRTDKCNGKQLSTTGINGAVGRPTALLLLLVCTALLYAVDL